MKKRFTFLIAALMLLVFMMPSLAGWGQTNYTISLLDNGTDSDGTSNISYVSHTNVSSYVSITGNSDYVNTINTGATFKASTGNGWKLSSNNATGNFTLSLTSSAQAITVSKVTINAKKYGTDATILTVTITKSDNSTQSQSFSNLAENFTDYELTLTSASTIKSIQVQANANKKRAYVHHITVTCPAAGPTQLDSPTNFTATPGNGEATFTWDAVGNASSYTIIRKIGETWTAENDTVELFKNVNLTNGQFVGTGLTNGETYNCKVRANGDGSSYLNSDLSNEQTFSPATTYSINITSPITGGSVEASLATATAGTTITLTATPSAGYSFNNNADSWLVSPAVTVTLGANNTATFVMPTSNVNVSATFDALPVYNVTCTTPTNGTLSVSPVSGYNGVEVTITATPNSGYQLTALTATDDDGNIEITNNKFNIRNSNVTVTASFNVVDIYEKYTGDIVAGDYVIGYISANGNEKKAMGEYDSSNTRFYPVDMSPVNDQLVDPSAKIWHIESSGNYWTIYNVTDGKYLTGTGAASHVGYVATPTSDDAKLWSITQSDGLFTIKSKYNLSQNVNSFFRYGGTYWACYVDSRGSFLYKKVVNSTMAVASPSNGTITATPAGGSEIAEGGSTTVRGGVTITLSATGDDEYVLDAWDVFKTGESATKVTVTNNTFTMPDYDVTVSASFRQPTTFTVQYSVNGAVADGLTQTDVAEGTSVTLPTSVQVTTPSGFSYVGWSESETSETIISGDTYTPAADTTLYLVFVKSGQTFGYNKVTNLSDITPGKYIIVNANYCLPSSTTTSSPVKSSDYSVSDASSTSTYTSIPANTEWIFTGTNSAMTIKNNEGNYLYSTNSTTGIRVSSTSDTWAFEICGGGFAMMESNNNRYCATYKSGSDWRSYTSATHENYGDGGVLYLYKKTQAYTRVYNATTTKMASIPATSIITVPNGVTLTLTGTNLGTEENLIIEDGGQLICNNAVEATVHKTIAAWNTGSTDGWYFIASPINVNNLAPTNVTNMISDENAANGVRTYDLYSLDNITWHNYRANTFNLANGRGYLYASEGGADLQFSGAVKAYDADHTISVSEGWNLIGNPYTFEAYPNQAYYTINNANSGITAQTSTSSAVVAPCTGIIVKAAEDGTVKFLKDAPETSANNGNLQMVLAHNVNVRGDKRTETIDNAIVSFNEGSQLEKFYFGNPSASIFIPQNGEDYAIAFSDRQGDVPLYFKANETGTYTISFAGDEMSLNGIYLIDILAEEEIDLSVNPSYTFIGSPADRMARFKIVFRNTGGDGTSDIFAYQSGNDIIVSGEGELQIFDVMGRMVSKQRVNGVETVNVKSQGVYIMKLNDKTQKIVVR